MSNSLPRYIALSYTDGKFLEYIHEDVPARGLFICQGDEVLSPFTKLEVVDAGNGRVHIRCCYNNKFLALRSENDLRISPVADEPVTDQSAWSCTMFEMFVNQNFLDAFTHVHLGRRLHCSKEDQVFQIDTTTETPSVVFKVHDVSSLLALNLPRFAVFTGDNGNYARLAFETIRFEPGNAWNINMLHEIMHVADGFVRVRNVSNDRFWRALYGPPHIVIVDAGSDRLNLPPGHSWIDSCFSVLRLEGENVVAFKCADRGTYLNRPPGVFYLAPAASSIIPEARLKMEEAVKSRNIYNVKFNVLDSKTRIEGASSIATQTLRNGTSVQQTSELTFTYSETKTSNWNAIVSASFGAGITIKAGIPFLAETEISFSAEVSGSYEWGKEYSETVTKEDKLHITAPPMTTVTATRMETRGSYDLPFSYTQEDVLWDGKSVIAQKDDGLYLGSNTSDVYYEIGEEPITSTAVSDTQSNKVKVYRILPHSSRIVPPDDPSLASAESTPAVPAG